MSGTGVEQVASPVGLPFRWAASCQSDRVSETTEDGGRPRVPTSRRVLRVAGRWAKRAGIGLLALFVVVTAFSFGYNAVTAAPAAPPPGLSFVPTGDVQTRYRQWSGPHPQGPPVVLVHGFVEDSDTWDPLARRLAREHDVQAYDMKGFGYTERRDPYTLQALSGQLGQFLDARGLRRPVLVAHSLGAGVVAKYAIDHPDRVGGVLFLDGDGIGTPRNGGGPGSLPDPWRTTLMRLVIGSDRVIRQLYASQCGPACPPLDEAGVDRWRRPLQVAGAEQGMLSMMGHGIVGLSQQELPKLGETGLPTSVVFGAEDSSFGHNSPEQTARRIGAPPPTLIPGARHLTMISNPDQVAAAVESLVARVRPDRGSPAADSAPHRRPGS